MSRNQKILISSCIGLLLSGFILVSCLFSSATTNKEQSFVFVYDGQTPSDVKSSLQSMGVRTFFFPMLSNVLSYKVRPGRYAINPGDNIVGIFRRLRNGQQEPLNLTLPSVRTLGNLAAFLAQRLMPDSASFAQTFIDSCQVYGYTPETLPALFIPNTYQVYWNISASDFMDRMNLENKAFWNEEREAKAKAIGLSHEEIITIASIVDEETANNTEKPMIAGMYIKRLSIGMPLQADPTVKFAVGDFSLRRIYKKHLTVENPYNTYMHIGLPPGPIRIPSVAGIDAVLNHVRHEYIYMCAKEDFSGTHNFARTYREHLANARKYTEALNQRNIK